MVQSYEVSRQKLDLMQLNSVMLICTHSYKFGSLPSVSLDFQSTFHPVQGLVTLKTASEPGRRAASSVVRLVEWEERLEALDQLKGVFPQIWGGNEPNCSATCMVLKNTDNGRRSCNLFPSINRH
ncbi:hypothetical protein TNCV_2488701 [Trichonephila clavipes]|nr:hypothetical protein TNCV_2488701 [Trichonephila clavipes]